MGYRSIKSEKILRRYFQVKGPDVQGNSLPVLAGRFTREKKRNNREFWIRKTGGILRGMIQFNEQMRVVVDLISGETEKRTDCWYSLWDGPARLIRAFRVL